MYVIGRLLRSARKSTSTRRSCETPLSTGSRTPMTTPEARRSWVWRGAVTHAYSPHYGREPSHPDLPESTRLRPQN